MRPPEVIEALLDLAILLRERNPSDMELQVALHRLRRITRGIRVTIDAGVEPLRVDGHPLDTDAARTLRALMGGLGVVRVEIGADSIPEELVRLARYLGAQLPDEEPPPLWGITLHQHGAAESSPWRERYEPRLEGSVAQMARLLEGREYRTQLDEVATFTEQTAAEGDGFLVTLMLESLFRLESEARDYEQARAVWATLQRLRTRTVLSAVAAVLPEDPQAGALFRVLEWGGDEGAAALLERLSDAEQREHRRILYSALVRLEASIELLTAALSDPRWFVARNAAFLLGERAEPAAGEALINACGHAHERVREAAAAALGRTGAVEGRDALAVLLDDPDERVRRTAADALTRLEHGGQVRTLTRALRESSCASVQQEMVSALGEIGTSDAVQRLIKVIGTGHSPAVRIAALHALVEARGTAALDIARSLQRDQQREVRSAAVLVAEQLERQRRTPRAIPRAG